MEIDELQDIQQDVILVHLSRKRSEGYRLACAGVPVLMNMDTSRSSLGLETSRVSRDPRYITVYARRPSVHKHRDHG